MAEPLAAIVARMNADRAAAVLTEAGYTVERRSYPPMPDMYDIGARHYVIVDVDGRHYQAQWHDRATHGTGFMANRGDGWDEATARRLTTLAVDAGTAPPEVDQ